MIVRLKEQWTAEYDAWNRRDLTGKQYVYLWADGIYVNVRLEDTENKRQCLLVVMGATADGHKELIAVMDGYRESEQSWTELLVDLQQRGLTLAPLLATGDGALGFWAALRKVYPQTREQRCWVHKTANVLNKMPKSVQARAKVDLHEIWMAETREQANQAFDRFLAKYQAKYEGACECLRKDREVLLAFYDFPAEHWKHLRTTNPIESTFATIRLRHRRTKTRRKLHPLHHHAGHRANQQPGRTSDSLRGPRSARYARHAKRKGLALVERIWTVVATCAQQGRSVFSFLYDSVVAFFQGTTPPTLVVDSP